MIYVTVGTHSRPFVRLVQKMDEIAARIDEEVIIQKGSTPYVPRHAQWREYVSYAEANEFMRRARVVLAHAAVGSIITARRMGAALIVVPRLKQFGEWPTDLGLEFVDGFKQMLADIPDVYIVYNVDELDGLVMRVQRSSETVSFENPLVRHIRQYIDALQPPKAERAIARSQTQCIRHPTKGQRGGHD